MQNVNSSVWIEIRNAVLFSTYHIFISDYLNKYVTEWEEISYQNIEIELFGFLKDG